jgi:hypothetical protein
VTICASSSSAVTTNMPPKPVSVLVPITANPCLSLTNL